MAARKAHNLEVPGSSPGPATKLAFHGLWRADWVKTIKIVTDFSLCPRAFFKIRKGFLKIRSAPATSGEHGFLGKRSNNE